MSSLFEAQFRHSKFYLRILRVANELALEGEDSLSLGLDLIDQNFPNINIGQSWSAENMTKEAIAKLCVSYPRSAAFLLDFRLNPQERLKWLEDALKAAKVLNKLDLEGRILGDIAGCYADMGQPHRAIEHLEQYLIISREFGDRVGAGAALGNLGNAYADIGEYRRAIEL